MKYEWKSPTLSLVKYVLKITKIEDYWCEWELYSISTWSIDETYDEEDLELIAKGSTKWDGCSDFMMGDSSIHFCELYEWQDFAHALEWVYRTAYGLIPNRDGDLDTAPITD